MFYIVGGLLIICAVIAYNKKKSDHSIKKASESFWDKEREANLTRRKDISSLPYITIPYDTLPLSELSDSDEYTHAVQQLRALSGKQILNLSGKTNTDLKLAYGAANLPVLMECDQNYLILLRTLSRMADLLFEAGKHAAAETVLLFSIEAGNTARLNYEQLATIYGKRRDYQKLDALIAKAEQLDTVSKASLLASLNTIKGQIIGTHPQMAQNPDFDIDMLFCSDDTPISKDSSDS